MSSSTRTSPAAAELGLALDGEGLQDGFHHRPPSMSSSTRTSPAAAELLALDDELVNVGRGQDGHGSTTVVTFTVRSLAAPLFGANVSSGCPTWRA